MSSDDKSVGNIATLSTVVLSLFMGPGGHGGSLRGCSLRVGFTGGLPKERRPPRGEEVETP